ncbi:Carboxypeptidase D [Paramuricea clavata]|uniref:Carboxypeptidase D n=1 Tax=Paramuricea clavata TaxID=317549 RepID=A0A6S7GUL4_PARCT|nr:Carboxypeptidase D [Paramuricea clavata]
MKGLFTRQKTVEKNPNGDVSKTVKKFLTPSRPFENKKCPVAIKYGTEMEDEAKTSYFRIMKKQHIKFGFSETGLVLSPDHGWVGASPDGIRECHFCEDTLVEFKCPYTGRDMDPKSAFLLDTVGGAINEAGFPYIRKNRIHYFQVQTGMAVCGLKQCDFVVFTNMGIYIAKVEFDEEFWKSTISTVKLFYTKKIISALLLQIQGSNDLDLPNSM